MTNLKTPVIVGVSHLEQRISNWQDGKEPLELMIEAAAAALRDASDQDLAPEVDAVHTIKGRWWYENPARVVADTLDMRDVETGLSSLGGNMVQYVLSQSALDIQSGKQSMVVITGAECGNVLAKAGRAGERVTWQTAPGTPDRLFDKGGFGANTHEREVGLGGATTWYALFENALRAANGETIDAHMKRVSEMWAGFSEVAADNPDAWIRQASSAEEIRTHSRNNRPVTFPYPKLMNANNNVDQAAALVLCDTQTATRLGIPESSWIYPWAATHGTDTEQVSHRDNLHSSPAIRIAGRRCLELADTGVADLDYVDVYSCFPSAVQVSVNELGLGYDRALTVTGGLTFGGGPLNNYVMHAIVRMVRLLRSDREAVGFVTSNGGLLTKHAFGLYSARPPRLPFQYEDCQAEIDQFPSREVVDHIGDAVIESYVVVYGADGPAKGIVAALTDTGARTWAMTADTDIMASMTREEYIGRRVTINANRNLSMV
ncbi:MAG: hypothetical protein O2780_16610 [Proteobacteria bacterium]|jgi:acetyl-CoA C-acetyltransferase|nr:hypothetical protein [Pseudomonadota bacterium]MDA1302196.1 hypothetical protein [Pseudomonadota bacterium]